MLRPTNLLGRLAQAARQVTYFGDRPVIVVSATSAMEGMPDEMLGINHEMHAELAALSAVGRHVKIDGTDHYSLLMEEDDAARTAAVIIELLEDVRRSKTTGHAARQ